jgi:hypothetical protein
MGRFSTGTAKSCPPLPSGWFGGWRRIGPQAVDTASGRIGGLICWEHWMPLARQVLHMSGEDIHIAAWTWVKEMNLIPCRQYAFEGRYREGSVESDAID